VSHSLIQVSLSQGTFEPNHHGIRVNRGMTFLSFPNTPQSLIWSTFSDFSDKIRVSAIQFQHVA